MMKKAMLFVAALLACHVANAQYFCTTEGTELHYVNYDEVGQSVSDETMTVKNILQEGNTVKASYYAKIVTTKAKTIRLILYSTGVMTARIRFVRKI